MYRHICVALVAIIAIGAYYLNFDQPIKTEQTVAVQPAPVIEIVIELPETKEVSIDYDQLECLAKNIYFEARGESIEGQIAVSQVVLNRVRSSRFPNTICEVIYQGQLSTWFLEERGIEVPVRNRCQFSWWCDGRSDMPRDMNAWGEALTIAASVMRNEYPDFARGAMWYHATYVNPEWRHNMSHVASIGNHLFYTASLN